MNNTTIDEGLYSRQLYAIGHEAMKKISTSHILIIGTCGLGTEIAKNIILSGVKSVTLHDTKLITLHDLSSGYYFKKSDIGKKRAEVASHSLSELNPYVDVKVSNDNITSEFLQNFRTVILTDELFDEQLKLNKLCRTNNIYFISAMTNGVFGSLFIDLGPNFIVNDQTGEKSKTSIISHISCGESGTIVTCIDKTPHKLGSGDYITITELEGMPKLNNCDPVKIHVIDTYSFRIKELKYIGDYTGGGVITQVKMPLSLEFKSLEDALKSPDYMYSDLAHFDRPQTLHVAYQALNDFYKTYHRLPNSYDRNDADILIELSKEIFADVDIEVIKTFSYVCRGNLCAINSVIGGMVAQEALKSCSNKFCPIKQFWYFDSIDSLSTEQIEQKMVQLSDTRYDSQIEVFGQEFQKKIMDQKYFVVGSGAIGCELLKNFAMMGLGAGNGSVTVTDMDIIERSNLNRQFLFRPKDIGKFKSTAAATAVCELNPDMNVISHQYKVGVDTETIYDKKFFSSLDGVANALDNVDARLYMDSRCVYFGKPLLESGTLGTKGNTQVIVPHLTESYGSSPDPPEESIPLCTLKNFPYKIDHTIQFARDQFEGLFTQTPLNAKKYLENDDYLNTLPVGTNTEIADNIRTFLNDIPLSFDDCIKLGYVKFHKEYRNQIIQLLHNFPDDKEENGIKFWSGSKRKPTPVVFDHNNEMHISYVHSFAVLHAGIFGIQICPKLYTKGYTSNLIIPEFIPREDVKISVNEDEEKKIQEEVNESPESFEEIVKTIPTDFLDLSIIPVEFEKDDSTNFHMEFITAASNLRATCYDIPTANMYKTKGIAGNIIPALATTTSIVAGLVTLELYKIIHGHNTVEQYRNTFMNLALPFVSFSEPMPAKKLQYNDKEYTLWDYYDIEKDITLQEFIDYFDKEYDMEIDTIFYGSLVLYGWMTNTNTKAKRLPMKISEIIESMTKKPLLEKSITLSIDITDEDENDEPIEVPMVRYNI